KLLDLVGLGGKSAADKGKDTRDYLAAAFPELNAWERAGADASSAGMVDAGFENQKELTKMQLHLSTPLIRLFLLVLILLLMPTLNFLPVWFALSLLRFRLPSR